MKREKLFCALAGLCAGAVTGLFGAGGGMVLVPLLSAFTDLDEDGIFPASLSVMLPVCLVSLFFHSGHAPLPWAEAAPYLLGSLGGGILAGKLAGRIPAKWLHRGLGLLILWGGVRYLCQTP